jgi:hypothetical protein
MWHMAYTWLSVIVIVNGGWWWVLVVRCVCAWVFVSVGMYFLKKKKRKSHKPDVPYTSLWHVRAQ